MFDNSSIMILLNNGNENPVQLIEVDKKTQEAICNSFAEAAVPLLSGKQIVPFDGSYKPNEDEGLSICNFNLPEVITDAVRNPLGLQTFTYDIDAEPDIRAIFVGERAEADNKEVFTVAFQRFRKEQYLSTKKFSLFLRKAHSSVKTVGASESPTPLTVSLHRLSFDSPHIFTPVRFLT